MKALRHTGIVVKDLEKMLRFYRDLLGFKVIEKKNESSRYIDTILKLKKVMVTTVKMAADDGSLIELLCFDSHPRSISIKKYLCNTGFSHIAFTVNDIEAEYGKLRKRGIKFNSLPQVSPDGYAKVVFFCDPERNFIEIVEEMNKND
ncbi:MAG: VOC family protein [Candidatus Omnitrophota bacterium]